MQRESMPLPAASLAAPSVRYVLGIIVFLTYVLIVIGGIVRITGSGLGCGDDWPLCNGQLIPAFSDPTLETVKTMIEYSHRIVAGSIGLLTLAWLGLVGLRARWLLRVALLSLGLLIVQVLLGMITVKIQLHYFAVVPHLGTAMAFFGVLLAAFVMARLGPSALQPRLGARAQAALRRYRLLTIACVVGFYLVLLLGAVVANKHAMWACLDLPTCPITTDLALFQMVHRAAAVLTTLLIAILAILTWRMRLDRPLRLAAGWGLGLTMLQIAVGVGQVMLARSGNDAPVMTARAVHLAVGAAAWGALVVLAALAFRPLAFEGAREREAEGASNPVPTRHTALNILKDYISLTKPGVITLLIFTTIASMLITPAGLPSLGLVLWTTIGGWLMASGAHAINCYFDRDIDLLMGRTSRRPLPSHRIPAWHAVVLGVTLAVAAFVILTAFVNLLAAALSLAGLLYYVFIYTLWLKRNSMHNIVIGGGAGAFPPLVGWAAATGGLTLPALFLFAIIFYWTPPHFWALALIREKDYARAGVPMLPVVAGDGPTRWQILLYTLLMFVLTILPTPLQLLGLPYLVMAVALGALFLRYVFRLLYDPSSASAWGLYRFSLLYLALLFSAMVVDRVVLA